MSQATDQKSECQLCGGTVFAGARKCSYCGSIVSAAEVKDAEPVVAAVPKTQVSGHLSSLIGPPAVAICVIWAGIARLSLFQNPAPKLGILYLVLALISASAVLFESASCRVKLVAGASGRALSNPFLWALLTLLFWPVAFPLYFVARTASGLPDFRKPALILTVLCALSFLIVGWQINAEQSRVSSETLRLSEKVEEAPQK